MGFADRDLFINQPAGAEPMTTNNRILSITVLTVAALALGACASSNKPNTNEGSKSETTGQYIDDATVTAKVKTAIANDVGVKAASNVNVETYRGVVQLSGFADSDAQASKAVAAAKKVSGVRSVKNDMRIKAGS
jgi:osmotically-inducible protein OsmY